MDKGVSFSYDKMEKSDQSSVFARVMRNVYIWMALGLLMTGLTAMSVSKNGDIVYAMAANSALFWGLAIAEILLVVVLSAAINRLSFPVAGIMFAIYAVLNGVTLSVIFLVYTMESIAQAFFVTAGTFAVMSAFGYFTKRELSTIGRIMYMLLIGLVIATVVNLFFHNSMLEMVLNYAGVIIFVGLTAYDTQKIKNRLLVSTELADGDTLGKIALMGSLDLYLDFINLFLYILRFMGRRK